jgi:hypothetical protein
MRKTEYGDKNLLYVVFKKFKHAIMGYLLTAESVFILLLRLKQSLHSKQLDQIYIGLV